MAHDACMRIQFAPPPKPPEPKTSWSVVFALAFLFVWTSMVGFVMWGPGQPPIDYVVAVIAHHWREAHTVTPPPQVDGASPSLRASFHSGAPSTAILAGRQRY
jgi:hypothetical protein